MSRPSELVVFSHLRWDFVWQRPQQLLSRLSENYRVWFVEEPIYCEGEPAWEIQAVDQAIGNVIVARLHSPINEPGFHESQIEQLRRMLPSLFQDHNIGPFIAWFYTPMAEPLLDTLEPEVIVYDCMDELSAFRHAPAEIIQREASLLQQADLVFTGGPSLYEAKRDLHPAVHCFPSSVDVKHFGQAITTQADPSDQQSIPHPRLGFFGVIDERLDIELLDAVATARPDWQIVLVGPVVKIACETLPRHRNIHYLGQKAYSELPAYLSGWDVCLLPFALNDATRFISPTKTLEYMAAERPIVSTSVRDVERPYSDIVAIARNAPEFIQAIDEALHDQTGHAARIVRMRDVLARTSWQLTAEEMHRLMQRVSEDRATHATISSPPYHSQDRQQTSSSASGQGNAERHEHGTESSPGNGNGHLSERSKGNDYNHPSDAKETQAKNNHVDRSPQKAKTNGNGHITTKITSTDDGSISAVSPSVTADHGEEHNLPPIVIIGAGPTGLSAAYHLGEDALLLEQNNEVGGWCRSIQIDGFTFDFAGHIMFSSDPYVHEMYETLLGDNVHWQDREAWVFSKNVYTRYPFQGALYGLPTDVIKECLMGAIEVRLATSVSTSTATAKPARPVGSEDGHSEDAASTNGQRGAPMRPASMTHASTPGSTSSSRARVAGKLPGTTSKKKNRLDASPVDRSARFRGLSDRRSSSPPAIKGPIVCSNDSVDDCCGDGVLESTAPLRKVETPNATARESAAEVPRIPRNFEEFIYQVWGRGIAKHFAIPYNRKLWAVPLTEMETSWLGGRVPLPDLEEMIDGALRPVPKPMGPNARFGYPLRGGFQALMDGFLPLLARAPRVNTKVAKISPSRHELTLSDGSIIPYEQLISTMPLPTLIRCMGNEAPEDVRRAAASLRYISVRCVHLGIGRESLTEKHWIYYPEETIFHRIFVQGNASPHCNPAGGFGLTCEITYHDHYKPLPCDGDALIQRCIDDCRHVGIIREDDPIVVSTQVDMPHAYVVYDHARVQHVAFIRNWLVNHQIVLAGRYSEWEYYNSDHAFLAGKKAAETVTAQRPAQKAYRAAGEAASTDALP